MRKTFSLFLASTALVSVAGLGQAFAQTITHNALYIGGSGTVKTLTISQDSTVTNNDISLGGTGAAAFPVTGTWDTISITQSGDVGTTGSNILKGAGIATHASGSSSFAGTYSTTAAATKDNVHSLATAVTGSDAAIVIAMVQDGTTGDNAVTDSLTATGGLAYKLNVTGSGNTLGNTLNGTAVTLQDAAASGGTLAILGNSNTITNTITAAGAIALGQTVTGNTNAIINLINSGAAATVNQSVIGSHNTVNTVQSAIDTGLRFASLGVTETISIAGDYNSVNNYSTAPGAGPRTISVTLPSSSNTVTNMFDGLRNLKSGN